MTVLPRALGSGAGALYRLTEAGAPDVGAAALAFNKDEQQWTWSLLGNAASRNVGTGANDVAAGLHGHTSIGNLNGTVTVDSSGNTTVSGNLSAPRVHSLNGSIQMVLDGASAKVGFIAQGLLPSVYSNPLLGDSSHVWGETHTSDLFLYDKATLRGLSSAGNLQDSATLGTVVTDASDANYTADLSLKAAYQGVLSERLRLGYLSTLNGRLTVSPASDPNVVGVVLRGAPNQVQPVFQTTTSAGIETLAVGADGRLVSQSYIAATGRVYAGTEVFANTGLNVGGNSIIDASGNVTANSVTIPKNRFFNVGGGRFYDDGSVHFDANGTTALGFSGWSYVGLPGVSMYPSQWDMAASISSSRPASFNAWNGSYAALYLFGANNQTTPLIKLAQLSNTGSAHDAASFTARVTNPTDASFTADAVVQVAVNDALVESARFRNRLLYFGNMVDGDKAGIEWFYPGSYGLRLRPDTQGTLHLFDTSNNGEDDLFSIARTGLLTAKDLALLGTSLNVGTTGAGGPFSINGTRFTGTQSDALAFGSYALDGSGLTKRLIVTGGGPANMAQVRIENAGLYMGSTQLSDANRNLTASSLVSSGDVRVLTGSKLYLESVGAGNVLYRDQSNGDTIIGAATTVTKFTDGGTLNLGTVLANKFGVQRLTNTGFLQDAFAIDTTLPDNTDASFTSIVSLKSSFGGALGEVVRFGNPANFGVYNVQIPYLGSIGGPLGQWRLQNTGNGELSIFSNAFSQPNIVIRNNGAFTHLANVADAPAQNGYGHIFNVRDPYASDSAAYSSTFGLNIASFQTKGVEVAAIDATGRAALTGFGRGGVDTVLYADGDGAMRIMNAAKTAWRPLVLGSLYVYDYANFYSGLSAANPVFSSSYGGNNALRLRGQQGQYTPLLAMQQLTNTLAYADALGITAQVTDSSDAGFSTNAIVQVAYNGALQNAMTVGYVNGIGGSLNVPIFSANYGGFSQYLTVGAGGLIANTGVLRSLGPGGGEAPFQASQFIIAGASALSADGNGSLLYGPDYVITRTGGDTRYEPKAITPSNWYHFFPFGGAFNTGTNTGVGTGILITRGCLDYRLKVSQLSFVVSTASNAANVECAIYSADGSTKLASTGVVAIASGGTGLKTVILAAPVTLEPGNYLIAATSSASGINLRGPSVGDAGLFAPNAGALFLTTTSASVGGALPASLANLTPTTNNAAFLLQAVTI